MTIIAEEVRSLKNIRELSARTMVLRFSTDSVDKAKMEGLHRLLDSNRGDCSLLFEVEMKDGRIARIQPNQFVRVKVTPELTTSINKLISGCRVELVVQRANGAAR